MRIDLHQLEREITPLLEVHGVELVALEWLQGPGHGILRMTVDRPGGDPRVQDPAKSISMDQVADVTRDVSTALDTLDLIEGAYTLEVGSPGPERAVQKRADFDRFAGLMARIDVRPTPGAPRSHFTGRLVGTMPLGNAGGFAVKIDVAGTVHEVAADRIARTRLHEVSASPRKNAGTGSSRRQQRLSERERSRAVNAAHLAAKSATSPTVQQDKSPERDTPTRAPGASTIEGDAERTFRHKAER